MIVRQVPGGVQLITQPDHAALARRIMERAVALTASPRRDAILEAIASHDNGWAVEDAAPIVDPSTGLIADFISAPVEIRQRVWPRGVAALQEKPRVAALVAQHALTIYDRFQKEPAWTSFFAEMIETRDRMLRAAGLALESLAADYVFLRLGDLISLAFCTGSSDEQRLGRWTVQLSGSRVMLTPDIFEGRSVACEISAVHIDQQMFGSNEELRESVAKGRTVQLRGEVEGRRN
jgi:hypothetical protein